MNQKKYQLDKSQIVECYHCGDSCKSETINFDEKSFCCEGCKLVYDLLKENSLCTYYNLNSNPGISPGKFNYTGKYNYLDNEEIKKRLIRFTDGHQTHITFYIPKIHCSSCIWLLENLHRLMEGVTKSTVNFLRKEATIVYNSDLVKLSEVAELLGHIGYEPLINLNDLEQKTEKKTKGSQLIKIGLAGFCFGNIMMLSFPEYFSLGNLHDEPGLKTFFGYLNLILSLPVFFYCAWGFYVSAWKSIRYRYMNIDAPIALAIIVTFLRSAYEIIANTGAGYMDSLCGIVFFMLIGRFFQNRTYDTLSFERDYKSYFPIGVTVKNENGIEENLPVSQLKKGNHIIIRNSELIPSDSILLSVQTHIDYSFITGESAPVKKVKGDLIYAGGKQLDGAIDLEIANPTSQSYLTQLWNKDSNEPRMQAQKTYIDNINKYFTIAVLSIAFAAGTFWMFFDSGKAMNAFTAVLLVACPCGLLLTSTFATGNILRIMGKNKFYLKNAGVIDELANTNTVIFDKTGTITHGSDVNFEGPKLNEYELQLVSSLAAQSSHPLSRKIHTQFSTAKTFNVSEFEEITSKGTKGNVDGKYLILGSENFVTGKVSKEENTSAKVFLMIEGEILGYFGFANTYREGLDKLVSKLSELFTLKILSGDNDSERKTLERVFGNKTDLLFNQKPEEKMNYVAALKHQGNKVMMIGDGLNDAGALRKADVGIAVSDDTNNFSPACDAILDGTSFAKIPAFIALAKSSKKVIIFTFIVSILYNFIGLAYSVQGILSPVVAAILMPISSISIVLLATVSTSLIAKRNHL